MPSTETFVTTYVAHHWAASKGGLDLFRRAARSQSSPEVRDALAAMADEVSEDRDRLRVIADAVGAGQARVAQAALSVGETLARAKLNGRLVRRSPLSDVLELEALLSAVHGKKAGWESLLVLSERDPRIPAAEVQDLLRRADRQLARLTDLHASAAPTLTASR